MDLHELHLRFMHNATLMQAQGDEFCDQANESVAQSWEKVLPRTRILGAIEQKKIADLLSEKQHHRFRCNCA
jgi:hypothetical protein